ncbi:hypothetical protein BH09BAC1_BH09BAC1_20640 [soil metagenome]
MKTILSICIILLLSGTTRAQDTLKKVIEYDITIDAAAKMDIPWLQNYIKAAGSRPWLEVLFDDLVAGKINAHEGKGKRPLNKETLALYLAPEVPPDTMYVIDPITFEERKEPIFRERWDINSLKRLRFSEIWAWNTELKQMERTYWGFAPIMETYVGDKLSEVKPVLWISL